MKRKKSKKTAVFELERGLLIPMLPDQQEPDGTRFFDLDQCAARFGRTRKAWADQWRAAWGKMLPGNKKHVDAEIIDRVESQAFNFHKWPNDPIGQTTVLLGLAHLLHSRYDYVKDNPYDDDQHKRLAELMGQVTDELKDLLDAHVGRSICAEAKGEKP
jgi:hypothetical protein